MSTISFNEFESQTAKSWKQKIQVDLKGADYNDTLIWKNNEGIDVKPFYHKDDFDEFISNHITAIQNWEIAETIVVNQDSEANLNAIQSIKKGADSIIFEIQKSDVILSTLLNQIDLNTITVIIKLNHLTEKLVQKISKFHHNAYLNIDIISNLLKTGNWFYNLKKDHSIYEAYVRNAKQISIDLCLYQNAGANINQQLAYALAHLSEYLNHLDHQLTSEEKKEINISYHVSVGSNYFFEIAKIKALRLLHKTLSEAFGLNTVCKIIATPTKRNKTIYDYNVNMLRTTTECMAAILGGANIISNQRYDELYHHPNEFGNRIARNQLLILKHESYFNKVSNATDGAYYIEHLTEALANKALALFKDIEKNGGFLAQIKSGIIQKKIKESAKKEQADFDQGHLKLVGTNIFQNPNDLMKNNLERYPFIKKRKVKTLIEPVIPKRLSENLEQNRLQNE